jgi:hypothetical protein
MAQSFIPLNKFNYIKKRYLGYKTEQLEVLCVMLDVHAVKIVIRHNVDNMKASEERQHFVDGITDDLGIRIWWMNEDFTASGVSMFHK